MTRVTRKYRGRYVTENEIEKFLKTLLVFVICHWLGGGFYHPVMPRQVARRKLNDGIITRKSFNKPYNALLFS